MPTVPIISKPLATLGAGDTFFGVQGGAVKQFDALSSLQAIAADQQLITWAITEAFTIVSGVRNLAGALVSARVMWPDGIEGDFTALGVNTTYPAILDGWQATYESDPAKLVTQPFVTRDIYGGVIVQPTPIISEA